MFQSHSLMAELANRCVLLLVYCDAILYFEITKDSFTISLTICLAIIVYMLKASVKKENGQVALVPLFQSQENIVGQVSSVSLLDSLSALDTIVTIDPFFF